MLYLIWRSPVHGESPIHHLCRVCESNCPSHRLVSLFLCDRQFPASTTSTLSPEEQATEVVREKIFRMFYSEIPYRIEIEHESWQDAGHYVEVRHNLIVSNCCCDIIFSSRDVCFWSCLPLSLSIAIRHVSLASVITSVKRLSSPPCSHLRSLAVVWHVCSLPTALENSNKSQDRREKTFAPHFARISMLFCLSRRKKSSGFPFCPTVERTPS